MGVAALLSVLPMFFMSCPPHTNVSGIDGSMASHVAQCRTYA
jgi:hypothetical protein